MKCNLKVLSIENRINKLSANPERNRKIINKLYRQLRKAQEEKSE